MPTERRPLRRVNAVRPSFLESTRGEISHIPPEPAFADFVDFRSQPLPVLRGPMSKRREREVVLAEERLCLIYTLVHLGSFHLFRPDLADATIIEPDSRMTIGWPPAGRLVFQNRYTYFKMDCAFVKCEAPKADAG